MRAVVISLERVRSTAGNRGTGAPPHVFAWPGAAANSRDCRSGFDRGARDALFRGDRLALEQALQPFEIAVHLALGTETEEL